MNQTGEINRVAFIAIRGDTADELTHRMTALGFTVTRIENSGNLLLEPGTTLMIGFPEDRLAELAAEVRALCATRTRLIPAQPDGAMMPALPTMVEADTGGATIAVLSVEQFLRL